jgi:hypothetical protein
LPVPVLVENEHLQIWQLLTALLAFLELKHSHLHIVTILNKQRKPRNILMRVCLCYEKACYEKGRFTKYRALLLQAHYSSLGPARGLVFVDIFRDFMGMWERCETSFEIKSEARNYILETCFSPHNV